MNTRVDALVVTFWLEDDVPERRNNAGGQFGWDTLDPDGAGAISREQWDSTREHCQLRWLDESLTPLSALDERVRYLRARSLGLRRRVMALASRVFGTRPEPYGGRFEWSIAEDGTSRAHAPKHRTRGLNAGDLVEVLSMDEIRETLNSDGKHSGLKFLRPMSQYCGRRFRVLKPVRRILDEHNHVMQKTKNVVILEGAICHGQGIYGREGCDRSCFFFWKEAWLRKVDE